MLICCSVGSVWCQSMCPGGWVGGEASTLDTCESRRLFCVGTLVHEFLHLMGHQHHVFGSSTSDSYLHQTFIYTVGDCVRSWGDFLGTRNAQETSSFSFENTFIFPEET